MLDKAVNLTSRNVCGVLFLPPIMKSWRGGVNATVYRVSDAETKRPKPLRARHGLSFTRLAALTKSMLAAWCISVGLQHILPRVAHDVRPSQLVDPLVRSHREQTVVDPLWEELASCRQ